MTTITRRDFLTTASVAAGTAVVGGQMTFAEQPVAAPPVQAKAGSDTVTLGKTGIKTSVLGMGTGTNSGREQRELGQEGFVPLMREAYDRGIRYIDTAGMYKVHDLVGATLKELPKGEMFVQTKTWARGPEKARDDIELFRRQLGMETLDTLLIHCMTKDDWPTMLRPVIDVLVEAKEKGQVRAIGVSCHSFEALEDAEAADQMDVHLVRINPFGRVMDDKPDKVSAEIAKMHAKNRGVIGMKIYGNNGLRSQEERFASLKYVLGLGTVHAFTIGFSKIEQLDETLELIERATAA
jgi:predicted aldo/keto reductase-like oxidoreductase